MTIPERVVRCGYTVEPHVTSRDGTFNPVTGNMRISEGGGHLLFPARLYAELVDDEVFMRVMNQAFFTPDDWAPSAAAPAGFGIPAALYEPLIMHAASTKPVQPKIEVTKYQSFTVVSTEEYEEGTALARDYKAYMALSPEERAARRAENSIRDAVRLADAVAEWEALREQYADSPAVLAVLDIHRPSVEYSGVCAHPTFGWESDDEDWPCTTYTAIKEATP